MGFSRLWRGIDKLEARQRLRRGVAVLEPLEDGAAERILGIVRQRGDPHAVAFDDEAAEAAFKSGHGVPDKRAVLEAHPRGRRGR